VLDDATAQPGIPGFGEAPQFAFGPRRGIEKREDKCDELQIGELNRDWRHLADPDMASREVWAALAGESNYTL
jgi:hypothetical protein